VKMAVPCSIDRFTVGAPRAIPDIIGGMACRPRPRPPRYPGGHVMRSEFPSPACAHLRRGARRLAPPCPNS
jgi:hypothetical protein